MYKKLSEPCLIGTPVTTSESRKRLSVKTC